MFAVEGRPNSVFLGLGGGFNTKHSEGEFTLSTGYNRHIGGTPHFSLGLLCEGVFSEKSFFVLGVPIGFYPDEAIKLYITPCYSFAGGGKEYYTEDDVEYFRLDNEFILKFGIGYNYYVPETRWNIQPYLEGSIINSQFVIGLGVKFNLYFTDSFR